MVAIYVDGDACPVKDETLRVAARHQVMVYLVSNMWLRGEEDPLVKRIVVARDKLDAADDWIAEHCGDGDVVITADIPLAARAVAKGAAVLRPNGQPLDQASIGMVSAMRDLHTHLRDMGEITGGPKGFTKQDRSRYLDKLETMLRAAKAGKK